jgi:hypothetical protein
MVDVEKLKRCAIHLKFALKAHQNESEDVVFLLSLPELMKSIQEAKEELIHAPRDPGLGLGVWMLESNINEFEDISNLLAEFRILLRGWKLPGKPSWEL